MDRENIDSFCSPTHVAIDHKNNEVALLRSFRYRIGSKEGNNQVIVKAGFKCDMASIPRGIKWIFGRQIGLINKAAIVHDYCYTEGIYAIVKPNHRVPPAIARKIADAVFYEAMRVAGVSKMKAWVIWRAVRMFGKKYWRAK